MIMKHLHILCTILFGTAVLLFFGLAYPHHLHYQEQYQLFLFDGTYVWDIVRHPGGVLPLCLGGSPHHRALALGHTVADAASF